MTGIVIIVVLVMLVVLVVWKYALYYPLFPSTLHMYVCLVTRLMHDSCVDYRRPWASSDALAKGPSLLAVALAVTVACYYRSLQSHLLMVAELWAPNYGRFRELPQLCLELCQPVWICELIHHLSSLARRTTRSSPRSSETTCAYLISDLHNWWNGPLRKISRLMNN